MDSPVYIIKFRGGRSHNLFRIALNNLPSEITVTHEDGGRDVYVFEYSEAQTRARLSYDRNTRSAVSEKVVLGTYHIFRHEPSLNP